MSLILYLYGTSGHTSDISHFGIAVSRGVEVLKLLKRLWAVSRRLFLPALGAILLILLWLAFPQPVDEVWPPQSPDEKQIVYVSLHGIHTAIDFPDYRCGMFQEWDMARTLDFDRGKVSVVSQAMEAFFAPKPTVIRFGFFARPYWQRRNVPENCLYKFYLSEQGKKRMEVYLNRYIGTELEADGEFRRFSGKRGWTPLTNCNGFVGGALRAAGLPIREAFSLEGRTMRWQLERCRQFQEQWLATCRSASTTSTVAQQSPALTNETTQ